MENAEMALVAEPSLGASLYGIIRRGTIILVSGKVKNDVGS